MDQSGLMDTTGKILFVCPSCGYRARIPGNYLGMSIRCPGCNGPQTVTRPEKAETTGKTVSITKVATTPLPFTVEEAQQPSAPVATAPPAARPVAATRTPLPGALDAVAPPAQPADRALGAGAAAQTLAFTCSACAYRARIPLSYAGRTILCPSCKAAQQAPTAATPSANGQTAVVARVITATPAAGSAVLAEPRPAAPIVSTPAVELSDRILVTCAACGLRARLPAKYAGQTIKCPKCTKPVSVPLSEAIEEATGRTVSIARADLAKEEPAKPARAVPTPAPADGAKPLSAPTRRPSGEIALPPAKSDDALQLEVEAPLPPTPAARNAAPVPARTPTPAPAPPSSTSTDDELDLSGRNAVLEPPKRGGVVKRRGSGNSSRLATPVPSTPEPERSRAEGGISPTDVALKTEDPTSKPSTGVVRRGAAGAPATPPTLASTKAGSAAPARAATPAPEPAVRAPARATSSSSTAAATPPASGGLPWLWLVIAAVLAVVAVVAVVEWQGASAQVVTLKGDVGRLQQQLGDAQATAATAQHHVLELGEKLDAAKQQTTELTAKIDTLTSDAQKAKEQAAAAQADLQKTIDDLKTKLDELNRRLEAALQSPPPKPVKAH